MSVTALSYLSTLAYSLHTFLATMSKQPDLTTIIRRVVNDLLTERDLVTRKDAAIIAKTAINDWAGLTGDALESAKHASSNAAKSANTVEKTAGSNGVTTAPVDAAGSTAGTPAPAKRTRTRRSEPMTADQKRIKNNEYQAQNRAKLKAKKLAETAALTATTAAMPTVTTKAALTVEPGTTPAPTAGVVTTTSATPPARTKSALEAKENGSQSSHEFVSTVSLDV